MNFTRDTKRILSLLIAIYFIVYTVSPLTYTRSDHRVSRNIHAANQESPCTSTDQFLPWKLSLGESSPAEQDPHNQGNDSVPIKKRRAIVPEEDEHKVFSGKNTVSLEEQHDSSIPSTHSLQVQRTKFLDVYTGFNPLCTGHSPPSIS
jgi:hypothetical protein